MTRRYLPLIGILCSVILFSAAAACYPGGAYQSTDRIVGYDWTRHFVSTLFAVRALNGAINPSRWFAIPAMLLYCLSLAVMFHGLSLKISSRTAQKAITIGGIGSMVYAFLAVTTPMHDLLVTIALVFFLVAAFSTLWMQHATGRTALALLGTVSLTVIAADAVMYYGHVLWTVLPTAQKLGFLVCTTWLMVSYMAESAPSAGPARLSDTVC